MLRLVGQSKGQVVPLFGILLILLIPVMALALNVGLLGNEQSHGQSATDAAALAAAYVITNGGTEAAATTTADRVAGRNGLNPANLSIEYLDQNGDQTTSSSSVAVVRVQTAPSQSAPMGTFLGVKTDTVNVVSYAHTGGTGPVCGLCILSSSGSSLQVSGNSNISVDAGAIMVNSNSSSALYATGNASITASAVDIVGGWNEGSSSSVSFKTPGTSGSAFTPTTGVAPIKNPLSGIPAPIVSGPSFTANSSTSSTFTMQPGIYQNAFSLNSGQDVTMAPGIYVFQNGFNLGSNSILTGSGVTMYFTCPGYSTSDTTPCASYVSGGGTPNSFDASAGASYTLSAPSSGNYQGVLMMADPDNTAAMDIGGTSTATTNGTIYAPSETINVTGNSSTGESMDSIIIAGGLNVTGDGSLSLDATQQTNSPTVYSGGMPYLTGG